MKDLKSISTPMTSNVLVDKDEQGVKINIIKYRGIIERVGQILSLVCACGFDFKHYLGNPILRL